MLFISLLTLLHIRLTKHQILLAQNIAMKYIELPNDKELVFQNVELKFRNFLSSLEIQCTTLITDKVSPHFQYALPSTKISLSLLPWSFLSIDSILLSDYKIDTEILCTLNEYIKSTGAQHINFKALSKILALAPHKVELQNITLQYSQKEQILLEKLTINLNDNHEKYDVESTGIAKRHTTRYSIKLNTIIGPQFDNNTYISSKTNIAFTKYEPTKKDIPLKTNYEISINQSAPHLFDISFDFHDVYAKNIFFYDSEKLDNITGNGSLNIKSKILNISNGKITTDNMITAQFNLQYQYEIPQFDFFIKNTSRISRNDFLMYWPRKLEKKAKKFIQENVFFDNIAEGGELRFSYIENKIKSFSWNANTVNSKFAPLSLLFPIVSGENVAISGKFYNKETNIHLDAKNAYADFSKISSKHKFQKNNLLYIPNGKADITLGARKNLMDITYYIDGKIISYLDVIKALFTQKSVKSIVNIIDDNFDVQNTEGMFLMNLQFDLLKSNIPIFKINGYIDKIALKNTSYTHQIQQLLGSNIKLSNVLLSWHKDTIQVYTECHNSKNVHQAFLNYSLAQKNKEIVENSDFNFSECKEKIFAFSKLKQKNFGITPVSLVGANRANQLIVRSSIYNPIYFGDTKITPQDRLDTFISLDINNQIYLKTINIKCPYISIYRSVNPVNITDVNATVYKIDNTYKFSLSSSAISYDGTVTVNNENNEKIFTITPTHAISKEEKTIIKKDGNSISIDIKQNTLNLSGLTITDILNLYNNKRNNYAISLALDIKNILLGQKIRLSNTLLNYIRNSDEKDTKFACVTNSIGNTGHYGITYANDKLSVQLQNVMSLVEKFANLQQFKKGNVKLSTNFKTIGQKQHLDENILLISNLDIHNNKLINIATRILSLYPSMTNIAKIITMQQQISIQDSKCYISDLSLNKISLIGCNIESDMFTITGTGGADMQKNEIEFKGKIMLKTFIDVLFLPINAIIHRKDYRPKFTFNFKEKIF
ncbi:hypothetical protein [Candidatus Fokinia crypta]|nr:hypothetical protein [Candidatus Fokinia cryptica]